MKIAMRRDKDILIEAVDFVIYGFVNLFNEVAEFLHHPKEKPRMKKGKR
jgi:hypothetical protein